MRFVFKSNDRLPSLAWCVRMTAGAPDIVVTCGAGVACHNDFFFEGCWNGPLTADALMASHITAATGGRIADGQLWLTCPSNTMVRLYVLRKGQQLWIANSMAFLAADAGEELLASYGFYQDDISSVIDGLQAAVKSIPLRSGARLRFYFHCNLAITPALDITIIQKTPPPRFATFEQYRAFLARGLAELAANANSVDRTMTFRPIVSISRGYDSVTCAVLAREAGCVDAVTMFDPESPTPDADNGRDLARQLGLQVSEFSRVAYKSAGVEWEFCALGTGGDGVFFAALESVVRGRLFISGFHGDKVWDKTPKKISDQIVRGDPSGADLEEFRLRTGFLHVALPFFGCREHASIVAISRSAEMAPWSVGGTYDRPICRRIAEEAGLARDSFGRRKRVMSRTVGDQSLDWYFGAPGLEEFRAYVAENPQVWRRQDVARHRLVRGMDGIASGLGRTSYRAATLVSKWSAPLRRYARPFDESRQLMHWSFSKMLDRYRVALAASDPTSSSRPGPGAD